MKRSPMAKLAGFLTLAAASSLAWGANAQPIDGLYIGAGLGANFMSRQGIEASRLAGTSSATLQSLGFGSSGGTANVYFSPGFVGLASVGWGFANGFRVELEPSYRTNSVSSISGLYATPRISSGGNEQKLGLMFNVAYDFYDVAPWVVPYLGVGVGYAWADWNGVNVTTTSGAKASVSNTEGNFAYQFMAGAAFPIASTPGLSITTEFRFMSMAGTREYNGTFFLPAVGKTISGTENVGSEFNYSLLVGLRYAFNHPSPPAAPMPVADMGAKTFLVFFDWNKADLTARSQGIVRDAAAYSTHSQYTRIDVDGNTDTSGSPGYNQGLSERRAHTVANELVRDGVPQNVISMHAYGDTKLLVPTGPGVREPQNRRVEIVFH